jgi:uncharacterized protein
MHYFDASFLIPLVRKEPTSDRVEAQVHELPRGSLVTSNWARVESWSGLGREVRMNRLDMRLFEDCCQKLDRLIVENFRVVAPTEDDFSMAARMLRKPQTGLRAGDALHLAIAQGIGVTQVLTMDRTMISAAAAMNIPASDGLER